MKREPLLAALVVAVSGVVANLVSDLLPEGMRRPGVAVPLFLLLVYAGWKLQQRVVSSAAPEDNDLVGEQVLRRMRGRLERLQEGSVDAQAGLRLPLSFKPVAAGGTSLRGDYPDDLTDSALTQLLVQEMGGRRLLLVGDSGSGKTTFLRHLGLSPA